MTDLEVEIREGDGALDGALAVRDRVFVEEQGVPASKEYDGRDDEAVHAVGSIDDEIVATGRLRILDDDTGKVERVAVLVAYRGEGVGRAVMDALERVARERDLDRLVLHGQLSVEGFYHALGYETVSDVFEEADMPHVEMEKHLETKRGAGELN